jgi:hypothetical protein
MYSRTFAQNKMQPFLGLHSKRTGLFEVGLGQAVCLHAKGCRFKPQWWQ